MESVRSQEEFDRIFKEGTRRSGRLLSLVFKNNIGIARLGIIVNKKFGNAVRRNRVKRLIREACRKFFAENKAQIDIVIIPRSAAATAGVSEIYMEIRTLLAQIRH